MHHEYTREDIYRIVEEEDIEFIRLQFVDIFGKLKNMAMTVSQLDKILDNKCKFDCAAIEGFSKSDAEVLFLAPDLSTFEIFPWRPQNGKVARFICDVIRPDGRPFEGDCRYILEKAMKEAKDLGLEFRVGSRCEFFLFDVDSDGELTTNSQEKGGYFDIGPVDQGENARRDMVLYLSDMNVDVEASYHSNEASQHVLELAEENVLEAADNFMTYRLVTRTVAKRHGMHATFMPKPKREMNGSGAHLEFALFRDGKNIFSDNNTEDGISEEAYAFMAGLLEHMEEMTLINNPIVNSYKRLVPGYRAPVTIGWSKTNRSQLIRIQNVYGEGTKIIVNSPDGACNPYLVFAACLYAGLDGMKKKSKPSASMDELTEEEIKMAKSLPRTLYEAVQSFEQGSFLKNAIGSQISDNYIIEKKAEWYDYCKQITDWEINRYLDTV